jgi:hypothetical protein
MLDANKLSRAIGARSLLITSTGCPSGKLTECAAYASCARRRVRLSEIATKALARGFMTILVLTIRAELGVSNISATKHSFHRPANIQMNCPVAELLQLPLFTVAAKPCNPNVENEIKSDGAERSCFLFVTLLMNFTRKAPNR